MHIKKLICLAFATLLPLGNVVAEEAAVDQTAAAEAAPPEVIQEKAVEAVDGAPAEPTDQPVYTRRSMEERWKEREKRYEELKSRAEEAGVMLPERPPWHDREVMTQPHPEMQKRMEHRQKMLSMTPEEREAYRMERYQEMRDRASEIGMEMPETPPWKDRQARRDEEWAKHQEVIKGMTDEERAACHAMQRRHMRQMGVGNKMRQGGGMYPPPVFQGQLPGYGYGPGPGAYAPPGNFWDPNQ
ncbi:MAG: hypothetical protein QNJ78_02930 [Gammaproteobacteria bacterium]|nr:hypothetical protein [Gammaproteobacteria bacterium]